MQIVAELHGVEGIECMPDDNFRVSIPIDQLLSEINLKLEHMSMRLTSLENGRIQDQTEIRLRAASVKSQKMTVATISGFSSGLLVYIITKIVSLGHA